MRAAHNNGMHPTADTTDFIFGNLLGRRVMPGVRFLLNGKTQESESVVLNVIKAREFS